MKKVITVAIILFFSTMVSPLYAGGSATPQDVIKKVKEAAEYLSKMGKAGLTSFKKRHGKWVWKDTYVFVLEEDKGTVVAHPIKPKLVGKKLMGLKDIKGNMFFVQFFQAAKKPNGGWVEYWWPKPGEKKASRKITYVLQAGKTPYQVGAGIYNDTITIEELNKLIK